MVMYGGLVFRAPSSDLSLLICCYALRTSKFAGAACLSGGDDGPQWGMIYDLFYIMQYRKCSIMLRVALTITDNCLFKQGLAKAQLK